MNDRSWRQDTPVSRLSALAMAVAVLALVLSNVSGLALARLENSNVPANHSLAKKPINVPTLMTSTAKKPVTVPTLMTSTAKKPVTVPTPMTSTAKKPIT